MTTTAPNFSCTHIVEADVTAAAIWALYADVTSWPEWDAQAELVTRDAPFAAGSTGSMKFAGQEPLSYRLTRVDPLREFVDETPVGDLTVRVSHLLEPLADGQLRITYSAQIDGPPQQAREAGPKIPADFPATVGALIALARKRSGYRAME